MHLVGQRATQLLVGRGSLDSVNSLAIDDVHLETNRHVATLHWTNNPREVTILRREAPKTSIHVSV
jgi:hypothetical protein